MVSNDIGNVDPSKDTILSSEFLSVGPLGRSGWDGFKVAERLAEAFPNAKPIIVIRNQIDLMISHYCYTVSRSVRMSRSLDCYLESVQYNGTIEKLCYDRLIGHYCGLWGIDNVLVLLYEDLRLRSDVFLGKMGAFLGVDIVNRVASKRPEHQSLRSPIAIGVNRMVNKPINEILKLFLKHGHYNLVNVLNGKLSMIKGLTINQVLKVAFERKGATIHIGTPTKSWFLPPIRESNRRLSKVIEVDLGEWGYPV